MTFAFVQVLDNSSHLYAALTAGLCFLAPWTAMLVATLIIQRAVSAERKRERRENR